MIKNFGKYLVNLSGLGMRTIRGFAPALRVAVERSGTKTLIAGMAYRGSTWELSTTSGIITLNANTVMALRGARGKYTKMKLIGATDNTHGI